MAEIDDGEAVHYMAVPRGTSVYSSDGQDIGKVESMLDNYREHIFDGVIYRDHSGTQRFADAPEVGRTAERGVTLTIDAAAAAELPPPDKGSSPSARPNASGGLLSRLFGGGRHKQ